MAKPSDKDPAIEEILETMTGRTTAIKADTCVSPPFGCGQNVLRKGFQDELSFREYAISGLRQKCMEHSEMIARVAEMLCVCEHPAKNHIKLHLSCLVCTQLANDEFIRIHKEEGDTPTVHVLIVCDEFKPRPEYADEIQDLIGFAKSE